jgi:hypothetical protein
MIDLTIILPTFTENRYKFLTESCQSLIEQDYPFYLYAYDNGSNSKKVSDYLESVVETINVKYPGSKWDFSNYNGDPYGPSLLGVHTPYVLFWTDDDIMLPGNLFSKMALLKSDLNLGMCFSPVILIDENNDVTKKGDVDKLGYLGNEDIKSKAVMFDCLFPTCKISMPSCILRTDLAKKYYNSSPCRIGGEWSIYLNSLLESDCAYIAKPGVKLRLHRGSDTELNGWNKSEFKKMHYAVWDLWINSGYTPPANVITEMFSVWLGMLLREYENGGSSNTIKSDMLKFFRMVGWNITM